MEDKNKKIITLLGVFTIIFTVIGSSLAYLSWQTSTAQQTSVTFTTEADFSCSADGGGNITSGSITIVPTTCDNSEHVIKRTISTSVENKGERSVYLDLWLDINNLGSYLSESENFNYILSTSSSCTDEEAIVESGNFYLNSTGEKKRLFRDREYPSTSNETYYLYIWLDAEETEIPPTVTTTREFDLSLGGSCTDSPPAEEPVLDENLVTTVTSNDSTYAVTPLVNKTSSVSTLAVDSTSTTSGMIPVVISNDGTVKTVYKDSIQWYNYNQKEWANAVLVSEGSRSNYIGTQDVVVDQDDILAYYVWIPRYKYKIWTTALSATGKEQTIDIVFQDVEDGVANGDAVGEYITHPAFIFGGEQLSGIWVAKFEISAVSSSTCYTSPSSTNCDNTDQIPRVLPNTKALRFQSASSQFQTILKFAGGTLSNGIVSFAGSSTYGLSSSVDSHMIKNSEWGAVAYLSYSDYGINAEIRLNNYWNGGTITGCGASSENAQYVTSCSIAYGSGVTFYPQSTTGNISGIFDMSGGTYDRVMGIIEDDDGKPRSGNSETSNSGFNGMLSDDTMYEDGIDFPPSKYYDLYNTPPSSGLTGCSGGRCYGHALSETYNWYADSTSFVGFGYPWFTRGGYARDVGSTGTFSYKNDVGAYGIGNSSYYATRSVLVVR